MGLLEPDAGTIVVCHEIEKQARGNGLRGYRLEVQRFGHESKFIPVASSNLKPLELLTSF